MSDGRITPYDLAFGADVIEERFEEIREEAEARDVAVHAPTRFLFLAGAGSLLQAMVPDEVSGAERREVVERHGLVLYHAWQFWRFGKRVFDVEEAEARALAGDTAVIGRWDITAPEPAGYLRLPKNLFWARVEEDAVPEPVDGFFWSLVGTEDPAVPPYERLDLLAIIGLRRDRAGFGVLDVAETLDSESQGHWGDVVARPGGTDFENILPGGEIGGLLALTTRLELLKLASRWFRSATSGG